MHEHKHTQQHTRTASAQHRLSSPAAPSLKAVFAYFNTFFFLGPSMLQNEKNKYTQKAVSASQAVFQLL